ncbi:MAG: hypothetical protein ACLFQE_00260 [Thermotogota bacterium]
MVELKQFFKILSVTLFFLLMSVNVFAQEGDFEDLDWELLYPEEILTDASAEIDISSGFFLSDEPAIGAFVTLNPKMHFLIFDGQFNIMVEQRQDDFGRYFQLANKEVSDYFDFTKVKYKNLIFYFGLDNRLNSSMVFLPRVDFNRKYIHFDYEHRDWKVDIKSPEWNSWTFDFSSPALTFGDWGFNLHADAFIDNSSSITYALSAGPGIIYKDFELFPFAGYEHFGTQPDQVETHDEIFEEGPDQFVYGVLGNYEKGEFSLRGGIINSRELNPFLTVKIGPLELSTGKALFLAHENPGRRSWMDVYWNFKIDNIITNIGFSNETDYNDEFSSSLYADFEFRVYENLFMDIRLVKKEEWLLKLGARYNFKLDFY